MSELTDIASTGPSAAFFDLDRTLISGSSSFVLGIAAWRADNLPLEQGAAPARGSSTGKGKA